MSPGRLRIDLDGREVATLTPGDGVDDYALEYDPAWRECTDAVPVSLSLPLAAGRHSGARVFHFVDNLLPDDPALREDWARASALPDASPFQLLSVHGRDVAGALAFRPEGEPLDTAGALAPVDDLEIARRIRAIRTISRPTEAETGPGQFSLAGAQAKFALARHGDAWFDAAGREPSTHILKPRVIRLDDGEIVEHVVMTAVRRLGILAARTALTVFGDEHTLEVTRFDRFSSGRRVIRIHQEDFLQATGRPRLLKYERDGGPSIDHLLAVADRFPDPASAATARERLGRSLLLSWVLLNTDGHAKNLSLRLLPPGPEIAPLYDVSSFVPYLRVESRRRSDLLAAFEATQLSLRPGHSFAAGDMGAFEWRHLATRLRLDPDAFVEWGLDLCDRLPATVEGVAAGLDERFRTPTVARLVSRLPVRAAQARRALAAAVHV